MNKQLCSEWSWHEGVNNSPVLQVLSVGYYDGPIVGALQCADRRSYRFDLVAWEPEEQDIRVFALSPLPPPGWKQLTDLCSAYELPRWPDWVFGWHEDLQQPIQDVLRCASPVEWVVATMDLLGQSLRVKAVDPDDLSQVTNWGAFLGMTEELQEVDPYLKLNE